MLVKTYCAAVRGISAMTVTIEVNISMGINFYIVGLPDSAVKESEHRIRSALRHNHYNVPRERIVINMAPADLRKEGSGYDLPLAIGILAASGTVESGPLGEYLITGELSLDGSLKKIRGALPIAVNARDKGFKGLILPEQNAREAAVIEGLPVYGMKNIAEVVHFLQSGNSVPPTKVDIRKELMGFSSDAGPDFSDVKGQAKVKRAMEIAAAGSHNLLMVGPPGSGKTMMARCLPGILPPMNLEEALETTKIHSVAGKIGPMDSLVVRRPFRDPHHTISDTALVGGGSQPQPGEISLAHNGVLFMDELPEYKRHVLEVLRQPMEGRTMTISRARYTVDYPASFMLVASMNPCPCGFYNHPDRECVCSPGFVRKYLNRVSGPLLDRIDIHLETVPVPFDSLTEDQKSEPSSAIRERVVRAREVQEERFGKFPGIHCNAQMDPGTLRKICKPDRAGMALLKNAMEKLGLSARAYDRILKVSRTIADLDGSQGIGAVHISEAVNYRNLDREGWGG